jgi:tetratricopeptide (TPR) repeat protein
VIHSPPVEENPVAVKPKSVPVTNQPSVKTAAETSADKRGFLSRVNPANLFRKDTKNGPRPPPVTESGEVSPAPEAISNAPVITSPAAGNFPRYTYLSPTRPVSGNRTEAQRSLAQGRREQDAGKLTDAVQSYRAAVAADPGNFDAQFALGYAAYQIRSHKLSCWAWEHALAIHPDSVDARYNFALALRALNCVPDAATELERVLRADEKVTKAHLTLGSIYAEQLKDVAKARLHYRRVLDLQPSHPRGAEIRQWLVVNQP